MKVLGQVIADLFPLILALAGLIYVMFTFTSCTTVPINTSPCAVEVSDITGTRKIPCDPTSTHPGR